VLRSRERTILILGGIAAAVILLLSFVVIPDAAKVRSLSRQFSLAEKDLADLRKMRPELERADRDARQKNIRVTAAANA
jgi:type II secretory pathway component PulM